MRFRTAGLDVWIAYLAYFSRCLDWKTTQMGWSENHKNIADIGYEMTATEKKVFYTNKVIC